MADETGAITPSPYQPRIPEAAYYGILGTLYAISFVVATTRTALQYRHFRKLRADDATLLLALVAHVVLNAMCFTTVRLIYWDTDSGFSSDAEQQAKLLAHHRAANVAKSQARLLFALVAMIFTVIYLIKLTFLLFFRRMMDRVKGMAMFWKIILIICLLSWPISLCTTVMGCPDIAAPNCNTESSHHRVSIVTSVVSALDILTDVLIVAIPLRLLWNVKIQLKQKLLIGVFLSLSVFMIICALVRMSDTTFKPKDGDFFDPRWQLFWLFAEASVAVTVFSITAFRALIGMKANEKDLEKSVGVSPTRAVHPKVSSGLDTRNEGPQYG